jgi:hypothetical protein
MEDTEYKVEVPELFEGDKPLVITVDKVGGGTLGSSYTGQWAVGWFLDGDLMSMELMITGTPKTHEQAAKIYADFFTSDMDTEETWPTYDRVQYWAVDSDDSEE